MNFLKVKNNFRDLKKVLVINNNQEALISQGQKALQVNFCMLMTSSLVCLSKKVIPVNIEKDLSKMKSPRKAGK